MLVSASAAEAVLVAVVLVAFDVPAVVALAETAVPVVMALAAIEVVLALAHLTPAAAQADMQVRVHAQSVVWQSVVWQLALSAGLSFTAD